MFRHTIPLLLLLVSSLLGAQADSPESPEALRLRIRQLESRLKKLRKIVEGTAKPINLARTSLATVDATPPNGGRPLNDPYYGILNAFDGGDNWHQGINYSYYLGNGSSANIVVQFDKPVTVTSIHIDGTCSFTTQLTFAKGGIAQHDRARGSVRFAEPSHGVTQMRLSLLGGSTPLRVEEVQILGHPNPAVAYRAQRPRIRMTAQTAARAADQLFRSWAMNLLGLSSQTSKKVVDSAKQLVISYIQPNGTAVYRVTIDKASGKLTGVPLVKLVSLTKHR